jgi:hypothetical protein
MTIVCMAWVSVMCFIRLTQELVEALATIGHGFKDLDSIKLPLVQPAIIHNGSKVRFFTGR